MCSIEARGRRDLSERTKPQKQQEWSSAHCKQSFRAPVNSTVLKFARAFDLFAVRTGVHTRTHGEGACSTPMHVFPPSRTENTLQHACVTENMHARTHTHCWMHAHTQRALEHSSGSTSFVSRARPLSAASGLVVNERLSTRGEFLKRDWTSSRITAHRLWPWYPSW